MPDANVVSPQPSPIPSPKAINWKTILIGVVIGAVLLGVGGYLVYNAYQPKKEEPAQTTTTTKTATPSATTPTTATHDWQTIKGEISKWQASGIYGFEFKAPKEFKITKPYPDLSADDSKYYFGAEGSGITFFAGLMEGPGPLTVLHGRADKTETCTQPLTLQEPYPNVFEACDTISVGGREMLWLFDVHTQGGDGGACLQDAKLYVVHNLGGGNSLYFTPELDILKEVIKPWPKAKSGEFCPENLDSTEVKRIMESNINNIRKATGLSESDNQRLQVLYQILSTFKFL